MSLVAGTRLGPYEIQSAIGAGGMGEVYRARDPRLGRDVAIKVLPAWAATDAERRARFEREAQVIASLNHPNIVTIYGVEEANGVPLFTMEYVDGRTLAEVIPRSGLSLAELLRIAIPLADAVGCAHQRDVVHRDLKPGNVMVSAEGRVKVLDFGLARLRGASSAGDDTGLQSTVQQTGEGRILGTVAYMSPEQAQGKPVDPRSDVFSLGIVLYEMATGERPFKGDTSVSVLSSILKDSPRPVTDLRADLPRDLARIVRRALHKDPDRRYQGALDLRSDLQLLKDDLDSGQLSGPAEGIAAARVTRRRWTWAAGGTVALVTLAVVIYAFITNGEVAHPIPQASRLTSLPGAEQFPAFSPDGKQIAFSWNSESQDNDDIYVQLVGEDSPHRRTTDPAPDRCPVWSPDGSRIAFVRQQGEAAAIYEMSSLGGEEKKLADYRPGRASYGIGDTSCLSWSSTGWVVSVEAAEDGRAALFAVNAQSRERRRLLVQPRPAGQYRWPAFSPDGRQLAFADCGAGYACDLAVLDVQPDGTAGPASRRLTSSGVLFWGLDWLPDGQSLVYSTSGDLGGFFRLWRLDTAGGQPAMLAGAGDLAILPAVSRSTGRLVFGRLDGNGGIVRLPLVPSLKPAPFIRSTALDTDPQYSPDGRKVAFISNRSKGGTALWVADADGTHPVRLTEPTGRLQAVPRWSPDSRWLTFEAQSERGDFDIHAVEAAGGKELQLTEHPADDQLPSWSSDGHRIFFASRREGQLQVWPVAAPPAEPGEPQRITRDGGNDTSELDGILYYRRTPRLFRMRLPSGPEEPVLDSVVLTSFVPFPDGLYYVTRTAVNNTAGPSRFEFRFLNFATGRSQLLNAFEASSAESLAVAPDRKSALYSIWPAREVDLMLLDSVR